MRPASGHARPGAHRFTGTATGAMARMFAAWSRVRRSKQPAAYARKMLLNRHLLERPSPGGRSRHASRVIAAGTARWSHPQVRISGLVANCLVLTKVDADLAPSAEQSMAQAPFRADHLHPSGVAAGHEPLTGRALGVP
jgi:hypothetical protein